MKKLSLLPGYVLLLSEITFLSGLKPNAPDTELSGTEKRQLSNIYYKYFGSTELLSKKLMINELANKWLGNERKKAHECQRAILGVLHELNAALVPAGPIDTTPLPPMDLSFVMRWLTDAVANEILILSTCTEVVTEVPVTRNVAITVNGRAVEVKEGTQLTYGDLFNMEWPTKDIVGGLTCTWSCGNDGGSMVNDGLFVTAKPGMNFNIVSTSNA